MSISKLTTRDDFEHWLAAMDDTLEAFFAGLPDDIRRKLDFRPPSLDIIEALIIQKYPDTATMLHPDQSRAVNAFAVYIGETYRKTIGGKWDIRLDDQKFAFHGLPILVNAPEQSTPRCPLTLATTAADRRTGTFLRKLLENAMN